MNEIIENKTKQEILAEKLNKMNYGDFISHDEISSIIKEAYPSNKYASTIARARKILLKKYNRAIENVVGDGYRIVSPGDFVQQSLKHYKRGFGEMQKGCNILEYAPTNDMSREEIDVYRRVHDRAVILHASMQGVKTELKTLANKRSHPFAVENMQNN